MTFSFPFLYFILSKPDTSQSKLYLWHFFFFSFLFIFHTNMYTLDTYASPQTMTIRITRGVIDFLKVTREGAGAELCLYAICHLQEE